LDELKIVGAAFKSRDAFETINNNFNPNDISPEGGIAYGLILDFYSQDANASTCDLDILLSRVDRNIQSNKNAEFVKKYLNQIAASDVSAINVAKELVSIKSGAIGLKLASRLASGKTGADVRELMNEYLSLEESGDKVGGDEEEEFQGITANELTTKHFTTDGLIQLWPKSLNDHIDGGVRGGHHILVFAPTEGGKTLFVINLCAGFLRQSLRVLYVGNEDPATDIMMRMINRLTGMNKYEVMESPLEADRILARRNWDRFTLAGLSPGTFPKIHQLIKKHDPQVLVLDQLRNIDVDSENRTQALEKAATLARNTARRHNIPVISVTQAGDSASGRTVLNRGDVDSSNIGIPGQTDLMIGIGANDEMEQRNMRTLSFPKNKISGRHQTLNITIDPLLSKVCE
jgi:archaellum biogenesis ATPase FlaH